MKNSLFAYLCSCLGIICTIVLMNCTETKDVLLPHTEEILPIEKGKSRISFVTEISYDARGRNFPIVAQYYKKEEIGDSIIDLLGRTVNRIQTYRSPASRGTNYQFVTNRVWTIYKDPAENNIRYAERTEDNVRFVILKFPVYAGLEWNGNLFNALEPQRYTYQHLDTTVTVGTQTFENCVMVVEKADTISQISYKFAYSIYAPGVGLIKKYDSTDVADGPNGEFNAANSFVYKEFIVEHN